MTIRSAPPDRIAGFARNVRGGVAIIFALITPALALLICGGIDLAGVNADRGAMQDAADATALAMAKQLGIATAAGIAARAQTYATAQLGPIASNDAVTVTTSIAANNQSLTVTVAGKRDSFFGNLLPPGGWSMRGQATASTLGQIPLCVLSFGTGGTDNIDMQTNARMTAAGCLVQSDQNITVSGNSAMTAGLAQAVGTASGEITPAPQSGAQTISDPFASVPITPPLLGLCLPLNLTAGLNILLPGTYCGDINVNLNQTLSLLPGEYYFKGGTLNMAGSSTLSGSDVVLIFDNDAAFNFTGASQITLVGRKSGQFAGFVLATARANTNTFSISSSNARQLEGAIYIPNATLQVTGVGNSVANQSAWTVVVAKAIQMRGSPNLVINSNYASSSVPAPAGVGPNYSSGKVALTQ
jgi:Flp pilus assembly protein TadG